MSSAIPIKYINSTGNSDIQVLVFTKNYSNKTPSVYYAAWQVLITQTSVGFSYPVEIKVEAEYMKDGQTIDAGPFDAESGSTWQITQLTEASPVNLTKGMIHCMLSQ